MVTEYFNQLPFSMKWGVYLDFFDSVGVEIRSQKPDNLGCSIGFMYRDVWIQCAYSNSRQEAQQDTIKRAFEIIDQ